MKRTFLAAMVAMHRCSQLCCVNGATFSTGIGCLDQSQEKGNCKTMLKRIVVALILALQIGAIANVATAEVPFPQCWPCPDDNR
jgi:hypothetical protein